MTDKRKIATPPVIRVFLSSTFADMEYERSYFNEVLAPRIGRICADRGVSFFNVDLRWGITNEEQISGQVLPICLGEIDKCRPYFIGMIGNRYGSLMKKVTQNISETIPWLSGKEGVSITELEMLYAVLDHEKEDAAVNSAFYMRSDRLSGELYPNLVPETTESFDKLNKLKSVIRSDSGVRCSDYDTVEEFGEKVMRDLKCWLDENFPESGNVSAIRREWYNGEILRGHIENGEMNAFLDSYIKSSNRSLLINGDGARGKTACLTAWEPTDAKKILINCASDEAFSDWTAIALSILEELCAYVSGEDSKEIRSLLDQFDAKYNNRKLFDEKQRELFRIAALSHLFAPSLEDRIVVVINDLNLLSDDVGRLLSWLPAKGSEKINYICSANDEEMAENADIIGWNVKEMPLFSVERAYNMINDSLHVYGKNLSQSQIEALTSSTASRYPGQLRFVISFLLNHGRRRTLDRLTADISAIEKVHGIYRYVYDFLTADLSEREKIASFEVFGLLRASKIALSERDCYELAQSSSEITSIEWARICRIFEQFDLIHGDYWYVRDEEVEKFVDELISPDDMRGVNERLAAHLHGKLCDEVENADNGNLRELYAYAKQIILCLRAAGNYGLLRLALCDERVISSVIKYEQSVLRSAWLELFLNTDIDLNAELSALVKRISEVSEPLALEVCKMIHAADMTEAHQKACEAIGVEANDAVGDNLWVLSFSEFGIRLYQKLHLHQKKRQYREMLDTTNEAFTSDAEKLNETELCKVYFFKCDALEHLGLYEDALMAANEYYNLALRAGCVGDMRDALSMRAKALYRLGRISEVSSIVLRTGNIAMRNGKVSDYLSTLNMRAMCCYRSSRFDESIELFDKLLTYWEKLGEKTEVCATVLNKSNALCLSDRIEEAVGFAERVYDSIKNDRSLFSSAVFLCGNIGFYYLQLKEYEKAERYLCDAMEMAKASGIETTLSNAYDSLGTLYKETDSFGKGIELYAEQMEFLWKRREFEKVMKVYEKSFEWLSSSNHKNQARELRDKWRERFSEIPGGLEYFEQSGDRQIADEVNVEKLIERAKLASSEKDWRGAAEAYRKIAEEYEKDDPKLAAEHLYSAATYYMYLDDRDSRLEVLEIALRILFKGGQIVDIYTCDNIILLADDEDFEEIARLWREIGDLAYAVRMQDEGKMYVEDRNAPHIKAAVEKLLLMRNKNEHLVDCCIIDMAEFFAKELPEDMIESVISVISENYRQDVIDRFDSVMSGNLNVDFNYLMKNYFGKEAERLIARYEKYVSVLSKTNSPNSPVLAGNLALIFRRRKEKEKAFRYHALSAEMFRQAGKMDDYFIEIINGATARKELSSKDEALAILREGLGDALAYKNKRFAASIAGNIASMLISDVKEEDCAEIENCFAIEEEYFRAAGYSRDLVVSLINQSIYYINIDAPTASWRDKVEEASGIVAEAKLDEFKNVIAQLEWRIAQADERTDLSAEDIRKNVAEIFDKCGYNLIKFEPMDSYYYIVAERSQKETFYTDAIVGGLPFDKHCFLRLVALMDSKLNRAESAERDQYIEWWNSLNKYTLRFDGEEMRLKANIDLHASDWQQLTERLRYFISLWEVDMVSSLLLMTGVESVDNCRREKLKKMEV